MMDGAAGVLHRPEKRPRYDWRACCVCERVSAGNMGAAGPNRARRRRLDLCAQAVIGALALCAAGPVAMAGGPAPANPPTQPIRIPMEPLGFKPMTEDFLLAGASGLTVDFVDNDHLLVTFNTKRLMKREPDEQPDDDDRTVEAVLLELPSGKVLAQTEWRLHDPAQYLWDLGHGRFLLRVRDRLTLLVPMVRLTTGDAFRGTPVLDMPDRRIVGLMISSDQDLLTLETVRRGSSIGTGGNVVFSGSGESAGVQINFYRLNYNADTFTAEPAGMVRAREAMEIPMTRAGILDILSGGKNRWLFNFNEHAGKVDELAEWDTACQPWAVFVSHSEFVAFSCRGSQDSPVIGGFNLKGEEMWEQGLYEPYSTPEFAFAPAAGRFVLERTVLTTPVSADNDLPASVVSGEEVRVYQTESGKVLLKVNTSPVERAGGNFALSPDGMRLAAFEQTLLQRRTSKLGDPYTETRTDLLVYPLPPLSGQDLAQVKEMEARAPADSGARIDAAMARMAREDSKGEAERARPAAQVAAASAPSAPAAGTTAAADAGSGPVLINTEASAADNEPGNPAMTGELPNAPGMRGPEPRAGADEDSAERRHPPTLYEPGESSQAGSQSKTK